MSPISQTKISYNKILNQMKLFLKLLLIIIILALIFLAGFGLWGKKFELLFNQQACVQWFAGIKPYAWIMGIVLLAGDLILPIPATAIMAALGNVYGVWLGTLISVIGSLSAGFSGYLAARLLSKKAIRIIASENEIERFRNFFDTWGGGAVIISRIMPILPEVISILAGLARMSLVRFGVALVLGTVPTCTIFAFMGSYQGLNPSISILLATLIPLACWPLFLKLIKNFT